MELDKERSAHLMLITVFVCELLALLAEMLLHQRIYDNLFPNGMSRYFPRQLTCPTSLGIHIVRNLSSLILVKVFIHLIHPQIHPNPIHNRVTDLLMILFDRFRK